MKNPDNFRECVLFVKAEGVPGSGKTTIISQLKRWLVKQESPAFEVEFLKETAEGFKVKISRP